MFWKRLISSFFLISLLILTLKNAYHPYPFLVPFVICILTTLGTYEFFQMAQVKMGPLPKMVPLFLAFFYPWALYWSSFQSQSFSMADGLVLFIVLLIYFVYFLIQMTLSSKPFSPLMSLGICFFGFLYVSWCSGFFLKILQK